MAALAILLAVVLKIVASQPEQTVDIHVIQERSDGSCPAQEQLDSAISTIRKEIKEKLTRCGGGLWQRVAYVNMTDPTQQCPPAWRLYDANGVRACRRPVVPPASCPATFYPTSRQYSRVCGRVIGYQEGSTDGISSTNIDGPYVDGVSITHGSPRSHIWTNIAGPTEASTYNPPPFVGNNYYCESGNSEAGVTLGVLYNTDPLWDGKQCEVQCCNEGRSPPWFTVDLQHQTSDDIEVRICLNEGSSNEDVLIELLEIYVN